MKAGAAQLGGSDIGPPTPTPGVLEMTPGRPAPSQAAIRLLRRTVRAARHTSERMRSRAEEAPRSEPEPSPPAPLRPAEAGDDVYRAAFNEAPIAIALLDDLLQIVAVNRELARMLGSTEAQLCGRPVASLASAPHPVRLSLMARKARDGDGPVVVEHRYTRADGSEGWARTSMRRMGEVRSGASIVCTVEDFTRDQQALEEQKRQAEQDPLTGLLNRRGGDRRLQVALERMALAGPVAVVIIDADDFKEVNDRLGHAAGDEVLNGVASRLRSAVRNGDDVARMGGDEFIVVARVGDENEAEAIAERCVRTVAEPYSVSGTASRITVSAGVAVAHPGEAVDAAGIVSAADRALYRAKGAGGNQWCLAPPA